MIAIKKNKKTQKNPKKPNKTQKNPKKPTGQGFIKKTRVFSNPAQKQAGSQKIVVKDILCHMS